MEMKAITDKYTTGESEVMALEAGADILLYRSFDETKKAFEAVNVCY